MKQYSAHKLHWLRWHKPKNRQEFLAIANHSGTIPPDFPRSVYLEVGARCNLSCTFCAKPSRKPVGPEMDVETLRRIVTECAQEGAYELYLHFFNEPLLHLPKLLPVISQAKAEGIPQVSVTTNITPLTKRAMGALIDAGLDTLHLSFEGANPGTYAAGRGVPYEGIAQRIREAVQVRTEKARRRDDGCLMPWMAITMVRTTETDDECSAFREEWSPLVDDIDIRAMNGAGGRAQIQLPTPSLRIPCRFVGDRLAIAADGRVTTCGIDIDVELALGDVSTGQTLRDIWHSRTYRNLWAVHQWEKWEELPPVCQRCDAWELHGGWQRDPTLDMDAC